MTDQFVPTSAEEMAALIARLEIRDDEPTPQLPIQAEQDSGPGLLPRSVKMSDDLDQRAKCRAVQLGMSKSAYIRSLIERDLAAAEHHGQHVADLTRIAAELGRFASELNNTAATWSRSA